MDQPIVVAAALGAAATIILLFGIYQLRAKFDKAEPELWTDVAQRALQMAEKDALEKDQAAKAAAAEAADAHAKIAAFKASIGGATA